METQPQVATKLPVIRSTWEKEVTGVWLRKSEATLVPQNDAAAKQLFAMKIGRTAVGDIAGARNPQHLSLYWTLVDLVAEALDTHPKKIHAGLKSQFLPADRFVDVFGVEHVEYPSIALTKMSQAEFNTFFNLAVNTMSNEMYCAPSELRDRFFEILEPGLKSFMR